MEQTTVDRTEGVASEAARTSRELGLVRGVPGRHIEQVGALDLRGVAPEEVARMESLTQVGVVIVEEAHRAALAGARMQEVGAVVEIGLDYRILIEPWIELSRAGLEAMPAGQKIALIGIALFRPDIPAALVVEKFERLLVVGVVLATGAVHGALVGRVELTGVSVTLPETLGPIVSCPSQNDITAGYLSYLEDGTTYINLGHTRVAGDVPADLLARKFAAYLNVGHTEAPAPLLDLLRARCPTNLGDFSVPEAEGAEEPPAGG